MFSTLNFIIKLAIQKLENLNHENEKNDDNPVFLIIMCQMYLILQILVMIMKKKFPILIYMIE